MADTPILIRTSGGGEGERDPRVGQEGGES